MRGLFHILFKALDGLFYMRKCTYEFDTYFSWPGERTSS